MKRGGIVGRDALVVTSAEENMWENSSEISSALCKPLEQKGSGVCYDSFRLHNTNGHYNGFRIREKK